MSKISSIVSGAVIVAVVAAGFVLGLFDLSFSHLLGYAILVVSFTYVGVMLGRRSSKANKYADQLEAKLKEAQDKLSKLTGSG